MDNEFEPLNKMMLDTMVVNTTAKNEHIGEKERKIRHVKERARCLKSTLPCMVLPNAIIKAMLSHIVIWMDAFMSPQRISDVWSPCEIFLRWHLDWSKL